MVLPRLAERVHVQLPAIFRSGAQPVLRTPQLTFPFAPAPHPSAEKIVADIPGDVTDAARQAVGRALTTRLVYTSFDGDHMHLVDSMCYAAHSHKSVPVNPEAALGYYISTTHHAGKKSEVMRDCVSLEMACEEFWIFSRDGILKAGKLPEGVVAEVMLWRKWKPSGVIRFFDLDAIDACFFDPSCAACALPVTQPKMPGPGGDIFDEIVARHTEVDLAELSKGFLKDVDDSGLRPLAFLSVDPLELKHIDWARLKVYSLKMVPFSPDTLIRHFPLRVASQTEFSVDYSTARTALMLRADELFVFLRPHPPTEFPNPCRQILLDLAAWNIAGKGLDKVHFQTWTEADVPKFQPFGRWALTSAEEQVNRGSARTTK